jgi:hypothetical protein
MRQRVTTAHQVLNIISSPLTRLRLAMLVIDADPGAVPIRHGIKEADGASAYAMRLIEFYKGGPPERSPVLRCKLAAPVPK